MISKSISAIALSLLCLSLACQAMPNPAAVYCTSQGHELLMIQGVGFCHFSDNSYCEEWGYYRAECFAGQHLWPDKKFASGSSARYCVSKEANNPPQVILCQQQHTQLLQSLRAQQYHDFLNIEDYRLSEKEKIDVFNTLQHNNSVKGLIIAAPLALQSLAALIKMLRLNTGLTSISLQGQRLSLEDAKKLAQAIHQHPRLSEVNLDNNGLNDASFAAIFPILASADKLQNLSLANNQITGASQAVLTKTLAANKNLLMLDLSLNQLDNSLGEALLSLLARNQTLIQLGLYQTGVSAQVLAQIKAILVPRFRNSPCLTK